MSMIHYFTSHGTLITTVPPWRILRDMSLPHSVVSAPFHVGAKGRVVLPAAVRRAAHIEQGDQVVARSEGAGRAS